MMTVCSTKSLFLDILSASFSDLDRAFLLQRAGLGVMASKEFSGPRLRVQADFMARTLRVDVPLPARLDDSETEHQDIIRKVRVNLKHFQKFPSGKNTFPFQLR